MEESMLDEVHVNGRQSKKASKLIIDVVVVDSACGDAQGKLHTQGADKPPDLRRVRGAGKIRAGTLGR